MRMSTTSTLRRPKAKTRALRSPRVPAASARRMAAATAVATAAGMVATRAPLLPRGPLPLRPSRRAAMVVSLLLRQKPPPTLATRLTLTPTVLAVSLLEAASLSSPPPLRLLLQAPASRRAATVASLLLPRRLPPTPATQPTLTPTAPAASLLEVVLPLSLPLPKEPLQLLASPRAAGVAMVVTRAAHL